MKNTWLLTILAALLGTGLAQGGVDPTPFAESPLIGFGIGQTLRITILATGTLCEATLGFRNQKGGAVPEDGRVRTVALKQGQTAVHDLPFSLAANSVSSGLGQRVELRAAVTYPTVAGHGVCRWSAEVFDQFSKRTTLIYDGLHPAPPANTGETHLSPIGGAFGQTVRLSVVADSPVPAPPNAPPPAPDLCSVRVALHSATGATLAEKLIKLAPGESDVLDLNMNGLVRFGERGIIEPCFMPTGPGSASGCKFSVQVFDQFTGWTQAFVTR